MAGDWIKLETTTPDKPEIFTISAELGITPEEALGRLVRLWIWADQQSLNGHAMTVTDVTVDTITRRDGFAKAMRKAGWLTDERGGLTLPNFDRHNGKTAKNRGLALSRKRAERSRSNRDKCVTREERIENITSTPSRARARVDRSTPIPKDWKPSESTYAWLYEQGVDNQFIAAKLIPEFVAFFLDSGAERKSWDATFIRNPVVAEAIRKYHQRGSNGTNRDSRRKSAAERSEEHFETLKKIAAGE